MIAILPFISRIGIKGGVIIALVLALAVQSYRINSVKAELAACEADKAQLVQASADAAQRAVQAREAENAHHTTNKETADENLPAINRESRTVLDDFIRRNSVQDNGIHRSGPIAESGDPDSGSDLQAAPVSILDEAQPVVVPASDLLICQGYYDRLLVVQDWAFKLNAP